MVKRPPMAIPEHYETVVVEPVEALQIATEGKFTSESMGWRPGTPSPSSNSA